MIAKVPKTFDEQYVQNCLKLVREKFPDVWKRLDDHETGRQPIKSREEYRELWKPIDIFLFTGRYSNGSTIRLSDLTTEIRFENRRQLGLDQELS